MNYKEYKQKKAMLNICINLHKYLDDWSKTAPQFNLSMEKTSMKRLTNSVYSAGFQYF